MSLSRSFKEGYEEGLNDSDGIFATIGLIYKALKWIMWCYLGVVFCALWLVFGVICAITVVGYPLSKEIFRGAFKQFSFINYRQVELYREDHPIANTIWAATAGWILALLYVLCAITMFATIILIPLGISYLRCAKYAIMPFGADVY